MGYYDAPEEYICGICRDVECEGCPGFESYVEPAEPEWIWEDDADTDGLTRQQLIDVATDIIAERDAKTDTDFIVNTYLA